MTLDSILDEIKKAEKIVVLTHENPDGDAIGSATAVKLGIEYFGKNVDIIIPEYSKCFEFLPGMNDVKSESNIIQYDLAISVDCADPKIMKGYTTYYEKALRKVSIDHHGSNKMYADINYVDPVSPACAQVLVAAFDYWNIPITKEIGTCLATGIITDTGGFNYSVTSETFEFTAELLRSGVNISEIYRRVFETKTRANYELTKIANDRREFLEDDRVTFTYITAEDEEKVNASTGDYEGIVQIGRCIEGVEVSIFLHEQKEKGGFKVSLRSSEYVNVSDVALMFGGGGHVRAAGAFSTGTPEQIKNKVLSEVRKQLKSINI